MTMSELPPGDLLLEELLSLKTLLSSGSLERTKGLKDNLGISCIYYKKSLSLFVEREYDVLAAKIKLIKKIIEVIEGKQEDDD